LKPKIKLYNLARIESLDIPINKNLSFSYFAINMKELLIFGVCNLSIHNNSYRNTIKLFGFTVRKLKVSAD